MIGGCGTVWYKLQISYGTISLLPYRTVRYGTVEYAAYIRGAYGFVPYGTVPYRTEVGTW